MPSRAWAAASAVRMSSQLCSRARSSKTSRQLGRAPQVGVLLGVAQAGAHVGSHSAASVVSASEIWVSDAPHGTTTRPSSTSMWVSSRQHFARIAPVPPVPLSWADVDLLGALAVEPLVDLLGSFTTDQRPRSDGRDVRPGSRWCALDRHATTAARQQVARPTSGERPAGRARRRREPARSAAGARAVSSTRRAWSRSFGGYGGTTSRTVTRSGAGR